MVKPTIHVREININIIIEVLNNLSRSCVWREASKAQKT